MTDCFFTINVTVFIENCTNSLQGLVNFSADIITEWLTVLSLYKCTLRRLVVLGYFLVLAFAWRDF